MPDASRGRKEQQCALRETLLEKKAVRFMKAYSKTKERYSSQPPWNSLLSAGPLDPLGGSPEHIQTHCPTHSTSRISKKKHTHQLIPVQKGIYIHTNSKLIDCIFITSFKRGHIVNKSLFIMN